MKFIYFFSLSYYEFLRRMTIEIIRLKSKLTWQRFNVMEQRQQQILNMQKRRVFHPSCLWLASQAEYLFFLTITQLNGNNNYLYKLTGLGTFHSGKLTGQIFAGAEREPYPTRRVCVRSRDFFAAAILWPSRRNFFGPSGPPATLLYLKAEFSYNS